jgi:fumarate reductase flavoprotein subunit
MKHIVIVGGGAAGLAAAVTAAEAGASVTVLEKRKYLCGNGRYAEGVFAAGSRLQKRLNIDADPDILFRQAMEYAHWRSDARLVRNLIDHTGETVDWLMDMGVPFSRVLHHMPNQSPEVFHMAYPAPTGLQVMRVLEDKCRALGVTLRTETPVLSLTKSQGRIIGVVAGGPGQEKTYPADSVLLATGGIGGNAALLGQMIPDCDPAAYMHLKGIPMDGDGYRLAKAVGAATPQDIAIEGCAPVYGGRGELTGLIRRSDCVWVNKLGQRFCDEGISADFVFGQNAVARQPGRMCWALVDTAMVERALNGLPGMMADLSQTDNGMGTLPTALASEIEKGCVKKADTWAELAQAMGVDEAALCQEVAAYNDDCRTGHDRLFGKDRRAMLPLETAPYYAVPAGMDIITAHGGIRTDSHMRVLGEDFAPLPGLYAAGIDISGVDSGDYSVTLSGHAFGFSLTGGRLAAHEML